MIYDHCIPHSGFHSSDSGLKCGWEIIPFSHLLLKIQIIKFKWFLEHMPKFWLTVMYGVAWCFLYMRIIFKITFRHACETQWGIPLQENLLNGAIQKKHNQKMSFSSTLIRNDHFILMIPFHKLFIFLAYFQAKEK